MNLLTPAERLVLKRPNGLAFGLDLASKRFAMTGMLPCRNLGPMCVGSPLERSWELGCRQEPCRNGGRYPFSFPVLPVAVSHS